MPVDDVDDDFDFELDDQTAGEWLLAEEDARAERFADHLAELLDQHVDVNTAVAQVVDYEVGQASAVASDYGASADLAPELTEDYTRLAKVVARDLAPAPPKVIAPRRSCARARTSRATPVRRQGSRRVTASSSSDDPGGSDEPALGGPHPLSLNPTLSAVGR